MSPERSEKDQLAKERWDLLDQLDELLEKPIIILGFLWTALLVIELTYGLPPFLSALSIVIWIVFIIDFLLKFILAPRKLVFLSKNWLGFISIAIPALRLFRALRVIRVIRLARFTRGIRLIRFFTSLNRGMRALSSTMSRRKFGYVALLTIIITLTGAAGMYSFEKDSGMEYALDSYAAALWWTAMLMTTIGSQYWPVTPEGRVLCFFLSLYAVSVFGYVTAVLATFFIGLDQRRSE